MKKKWFMLGLIVLTIINISALGTFLYNRLSNDEGNNMPCDTVTHGCYLKSHLKISDEQALNLDSSESMYRHKTDPIIRQIIEKRSILVAELIKEESDTIKIGHVLNEINSLQALIQKDALDRLIREKNILRPEQRSGYFSLILGKLCYEADSLLNTKCQQQSNHQ